MSAQPAKKRPLKTGLKKSLPCLMVVLIFACLCLTVHQYVFHTVRIAGTSMVDTLRSGDIVLVTRFDYRTGTVQRGDIVECSFPGRSGTYIKRVIGLPGERVEIIDSRVYINGEPLSESYASGSSKAYSAELGENEYLVLGDNRAASYDSRAEDMGFIGRENLLGRVRVVLWPFRKIN